MEYLPHSSEKEQEKGKTLYEDSEVHANFDWRKELNEREENREKYGGDLSPKKRMEWDVFYDGKTLKDIPYEETKKYVKKVMIVQKIYQWIYHIQ